jgi:hypothetical protein
LETSLTSSSTPQYWLVLPLPRGAGVLVSPWAWAALDPASLAHGSLRWSSPSRLAMAGAPCSWCSCRWLARKSCRPSPPATVDRGGPPCGSVSLSLLLPPLLCEDATDRGVYPHSLPTPAGELLNAVARVDEPFLPEDEVSVPPHLSHLEADAPARLVGLYTLRPCSPGGGILMGAASAAAKPLRSMSLGGEHDF